MTPWYVFERTRAYREAGLRVTQPSDLVVEVGCATGQTVAYLAACCRRVVGADKSQSDLSIARQRHPALQFESVDATSAESLTRLRDMVLRHGAPRAGSDDKCDAAIDVVFLDLGGIRPLEDYMPLMHLVDNTLQPRRALVIKSLYLARNAKLRDELCTDLPLSSGTNPTVKSIRRRVIQEAALRQLLSLNAQFELASIADAESDRSAATRFEKFRAGAGRECHGALLMALFAVRVEDPQRECCIVLTRHELGKRIDLDGVGKQVGSSLLPLTAKALKHAGQNRACSYPELVYVQCMFDWTLSCPISTLFIDRTPLIFLDKTLLDEERVFIELNCGLYASLSSAELLRVTGPCQLV